MRDVRTVTCYQLIMNNRGRYMPLSLGRIHPRQTKKKGIKSVFLRTWLAEPGRHTCREAMEAVYNQVKSVLMSVWQRVILLIGSECSDI